MELKDLGIAANHRSHLKQGANLKDLCPCLHRGSYPMARALAAAILLIAFCFARPLGANELVNNLHFPGHYYDEESGLYYNGHRYYDPRTGRYLTSDPIGLAGGLNLYNYALANPAKYVDRFGLLVDAYYDRITGAFRVVDRDTGASESGFAISGGAPFGDPLPSGDYEILDQARNPESFRLDPIDGNPRNDVHDPSGRIRFRLHEPGNTTGCIALEDRSEWVRIRNLINSTRTDVVQDNSSPWWAPWRRPEPITRYGNLYVR